MFIHFTCLNKSNYQRVWLEFIVYTGYTMAWWTPNSLYSTGCKATIFVHVRTLAGNALLIPSHLQAQLDAIRNKCLGCVCVCAIINISIDMWHYYLILYIYIVLLYIYIVYIYTSAQKVCATVIKPHVYTYIVKIGEMTCVYVRCDKARRQLGWPMFCAHINK
jgi:hypothetical protein